MRRNYFSLSLLLMSLVLLGSCSSTTENATASAVNAQMTLLDGAANSYHSRPGTVEVRVVFTANDSGNEIYGQDLTHNETFACDGMNLSPDHSLRYTFWGAVPDVPSSGTLTCMYTRDTATTQLVIPISRLQVLAPSPNVTIPSQQDLLIHFAPIPSDAATKVSAVFITTPDYSSIPPNAHTYAPVPISDMIAVPAHDLASFAGQAVTLNVTMTQPITAVPGDFHSLSITYTDAVQVPLKVQA